MGGQWTETRREAGGAGWKPGDHAAGTGTNAARKKKGSARSGSPRRSEPNLNRCHQQELNRCCRPAVPPARCVPGGHPTRSGWHFLAEWRLPPPPLHTPLRASNAVSLSTFTSRYACLIHPRVSNPVTSVFTLTSHYTCLIHPRVSNPVSSVSTFTSCYACLIHPCVSNPVSSVSTFTSHYTCLIHPHVSNPVSSVSSFTSCYTCLIHPHVSNPCHQCLHSPVITHAWFIPVSVTLCHQCLHSPVITHAWFIPVSVTLCHQSTFTSHYTCLIHPLYTSNFVSVPRATLTIVTPAWFSHLYRGMGNLLWILWLFDRPFCTTDHINLSCRCFSTLHDNNSRVHPCLADS